MEVVWCDVAFGSEGLIGISKTAGVGWKRACHAAAVREGPAFYSSVCCSARCVERRGGGRAAGGQDRGLCRRGRAQTSSCCPCVGLLRCSVGPDSLRPHGLARQAPLSVGFPRQECCSGVPFPPPGDLPNPGMEPTSLASPAWQTGSLPLAPPGKPPYWLWELLRGFEQAGNQKPAEELFFEGHGRRVHMEQWCCQRVGVF